MTKDELKVRLRAMLKAHETTFRALLILRSVAAQIPNVDQQCKDMEDNPHVLNHVQGLFAPLFAALDKEEADEQFEQALRDMPTKGPLI